MTKDPGAPVRRQVWIDVEQQLWSKVVVANYDPDKHKHGAVKLAGERLRDFVEDRVGIVKGNILARLEEELEE